MAESQDVSGTSRLPTQLSQTTEEIARAAVAAAAAVRPRPSIVVSSKHHTPSLHRWRRHMSKALHLNSNFRERDRSLFNPEILTRQKRQWSELQLQALEKKQQRRQRPRFFEHFVVVGLHPNTNVDATEDAFAKKKAWQRHPERVKYDAVKNHGRGPTPPTLEPQVLFKYPPGKRLPLKSTELPAFCFPSGVEARLMERTPSMSDLNEIMYGQSHQSRDDQSFVFLLKVADNMTLYGVCVLVPEIVQRLPGILSINTELSHPSPPSRFLVSAPRCYCFLTRVPFFNLHIEVLNSIIAQERLERITQCVNEMSLAQHVIPKAKVVSKGEGRISSAHSEEDPDGWMDSAIPVDSVLGATAAASGLISEEEVPSFSPKYVEPLSPGGHPELSSPVPKHVEFEGSQVNGVMNKEEVNSKDQQEISRDQENEMRSPSAASTITENGHCAVNKEVSPSSSVGQPKMSVHERAESSDSAYSSIFESSARSNESDEDVGDEEASPSNEEDSYGSRAVLAWAEANNNDSLKIVCAYHRTPVPGRGDKVVFQPLEHLQALTFLRRKDIPITLTGSIDLHPHARHTTLEVAEIQAAVMAGEEALAISTWAIATLCRALSLENVLSLFAGALLEKQMVVICPNLGVLSAVVMAVIPMIRPYEWQSLLLPILPDKLLDFLEAPVPFIVSKLGIYTARGVDVATEEVFAGTFHECLLKVGVQRKNSEVRARSGNLMRVNVYKNKVTTSSIPMLPRQKELVSTLEPYYHKLAGESNTAKRHPIFDCSNTQARGADGFLAVIRNYLESLCMDLRAHTITNVQSNDDKVSLLLKESFVDSFAHRDRLFMKLFAETQQFSVYTDAVLSSHQHS